MSTLEKSQMSTQTNKIIHIDNKKIFGCTTLKDKTLPEQNNTALHVCINPKEVMKNRVRLSTELNMPLENWVLPWQKHTNKMAQVTKKDIGKGACDKDTSIMDVDALYTTEPNILIGVFTADCLGILVVDETTPCICTIHSGWKGTTLEITQKCIQELIDKNLLHPKTTKVYFSPSIQYDSLEVGMEVVEQIKKIKVDTTPYIKYIPNDKAYIDNQGINIQMCLDLGIPQENIVPSSYDTKKELNTCFSYRNDKKTGEHFTFGYIKQA